MKRHHDRGTSYKGQHSLEAGLQFRALDLQHQGGKQSGLWNDAGDQFSASRMQHVGKEASASPRNYIFMSFQVLS